MLCDHHGFLIFDFPNQILMQKPPLSPRGVTILSEIIVRLILKQQEFKTWKNPYDTI